MALADSAGLSDLVAERVSVPGSAGAHVEVKVSSLVAGMIAGADSIADMGLLRHGGMGRAFDQTRAATTLGSHLRGYTFGHVRQLDASRLLAGLAGRVPGLLVGADQVAYVDIDDTIRETHGYAKQGAGYGYSGVKGLNPQVATISTLQAAPVIAGIRLRRGTAASAHGASRMIADALATAKKAGAGGLVTVRADSAYYQHETVGAARRGGAHFSITARMDPAVVAAISRIPEQACVPIKYPSAIWDEAEDRWVFDAEVAAIGYTAFTSRKKAQHVAARLIVRRVKRLNPAPTRSGQDELLPAYRHHAVLTDSPLGMLEAEASHRDHAIIEQVIADLKNGPLAHCPSGVFTANSAWTVLAAIAYNLTRAAGVLASRFHARARTATIRDQLIAVPARIANCARRWVAPAPQLALADRLADALRHNHPDTFPQLTSNFCPDEKEPIVEKPGRPADHPRPPTARPFKTRTKARHHTPEFTSAHSGSASTPLPAAAPASPRHQRRGDHQLHARPHNLTPHSEGSLHHVPGLDHGATQKALRLHFNSASCATSPRKPMSSPIGSIEDKTSRPSTQPGLGIALCLLSKHRNTG